jgi:hypothetical protein
MKRGTILLAAVLAGSAWGCSEDKRDVTPPTPPRGVFSVTGDQSAAIHWLSNTEGDLAGYHVYFSDCPGGPGCPFQRIGTTSQEDFVAGGLANGATYYFAVSAFDYSGNESELSYDNVFDTPRPAGNGATLLNFVTHATGPTAWDFSGASAVRSDDPVADVFFGDNGSVSLMFAVDTYTDIQDAGWQPDLDGVDFAPAQGWSPTGSVELIPGHCYVVWTRDDNFAKFRVVGLTSDAVTFDWAYQVARGNRELAVRSSHLEPNVRRTVTWTH